MRSTYAVPKPVAWFAVAFFLVDCVSHAAASILTAGVVIIASVYGFGHYSLDIPNALS